MAGARWLIMGWLVVAGLTPTAAAAGDPAGRPGLVVHLIEPAELADKEMTVAKVEVEQIFHNVGVEIVWAGTPIPIPSSIAAQHGRRYPHVVVFVTNAQTPAVPGDEAGGEACRDLGRARVFRNRIDAEAGHHQTDPGLVLGRVMAHEIGHLLLPPHSHSPWGIMRPTVDFDPVGLHVFETIQARTIRTSLTAAASR